MQYSQLQAFCAQRLDNRTDLSNVIYNYSQGRITYWSSYFFYPSDVVDTSLTTSPGVIFYNLPNGMRNVRRMRMLLGNNQAAQVIGTTTTTAQVTLPQASIPVVTTNGFAATNSLISVGGSTVYYGSVDPTHFLQCVGVAPNPVQGVYPSGTGVIQLVGVWIDLTKVSYDRVLDIDVLSPPLQSLPSEYAQIGLQFRVYPSASATYPLELTGNSAPAPPLIDTDDNFWTQDAAWLLIASTVNEVRRGYLHEEALQQDMALEKRERDRLMKESMDLIDNTQIRLYI